MKQRHLTIIASILAIIPVIGCDTSSSKGSTGKKTPPPPPNWSPSPWAPPAPQATPSAPLQKTPPAGQAPKAAMAPHEEPWAWQRVHHRFGAVWAGTTVSHNFEFINRSDKTLHIPRPKAHCSCSSSDDWSKVVKPGEKGVIPFVMRTRNKFGKVQEYLDVKSAEEGGVTTRLWLVGEVKTVCQTEVIEDAAVTAGKKDMAKLKKSKGYFGKIGKGDVLHRVVRMWKTIDGPLELKHQPNAGSPYFDIKIDEVKKGEEWRITIDGKGPFPVGRFGTTLMFTTGIPDRPYYRVPVMAEVPPRIEVIPHKMVVDETSMKLRQRLIRINNHGDTPIEITGLAVTDPAYEIKLLPPDAKYPNQIRIEVTLPEGDYRPPEYGEMVRIRTSDKEKSEIKLMILPHMMKAATPRPADKPLKFHEREVKK